MKLVLGLRLTAVVTMIPTWISSGTQAKTITTIQTRRLRGGPVVHKRTTFRDVKEETSHQSLLDPRPQYAPTTRASPDMTAIIDEQDGNLGEEYRRMQRNNKTLHALPAGALDREFNSTLFEELHNAPFEIYESAFGIGKEEREDSFPVFIVPNWDHDTTGVFSGFSRTATPLTFQSMQTLLSWKDIVEASTGAEEALTNFMHRNNFQASLFIGKTIGEAISQVPFIGLIVSYHQSSQKNILVPFAKLEDFFHDTSEKFLLDESTQHLEHDALHEILDEERANNTTNTFFHPDIVADTHSNNRQEHLEDIEALHFRRLFQLLIRRTFLFSFGYADCLKEEPNDLRMCLDDTFSLVVQMEATVRDAMDDQLVEELAKLTKLTNTSELREACVSTTSGSFGIDKCSVSGFQGLGSRVPISTIASSIFR